MDALTRYHWPGNVRELRTAMEHAVVLCRSDVILLRDLPLNVRAALSEAEVTAKQVVAAGNLTVKEAEKELIMRALKEKDGNRSEAAKQLGMSRRTLHRKLHAYHLEGF
jgi:two-component system response regulator HydG